MHDPQDAPAPHRRAASMWRRYVRFWGPRAEADVDDELRYHIEMRVRDYVERGYSEAEARDATMRRLGDLVAARSVCVAITSRRERRMTRHQVVDALVQDLRFALRTLRKQKGWASVGVLTLALGIGANAAVFSVVNTLLLHPLPYPGADRLVVVYDQPSTGNNTGISVRVLPSAKVLGAWRENARSFEALEGFSTSELVFEPGNGTPVALQAASILPSFARFAGQTPLVGRTFLPADVTAGGKVVLLSEGIWRMRFASDTSVIGKPILLGGASYQVVGVMPATFKMPLLLQDVTDLWLPLDLLAPNLGLSIVGRLRPGISYRVATSELDSIAARAQGAAGASAQPDFEAVVVPPRDLVHFQDSLLLLAGVVAMVLIIACANVAHLFLARGAARQREIAIRATLGAGSSRIFRQLVTESLVLAVAGCVAGVFVGWVGLHALLALRPASLSQLGAAHLDATTLLFAIGVSLVTGVVFGLVGGTQSSRLATHDALKAGSLAASRGRSSSRARSLLVVTEMALSTTLLVGATLLVRSIMHLQMTDLGYEPAGMYAVWPSLPSSSYKTKAAKFAYYEEFVRRARALPGVETATLVGAAPPGRSFKIGALEIEGEAPAPAGTTSFIDNNEVERDFFRIMGIRLAQGSTFSDTTEAGAQVIINEGLARKHWPGQSALGHRLRVVYAGQGDWKTIVGVARDAATGGLMSEKSHPMLYLPRPANATGSIVLKLREPATAIPALRAIAQSLDRRLPPPEVTSIARSMSNSIAAPRFAMLLLTVFTALALVLAAVGLYGVMAYAVAQRTREIGIRIALGATRRRIARSVLVQGIGLGVAGLAVGLVAANWGTRVLNGMLSGVTAHDPVSFAIAGAVLLGTAVVACVVPLTRAVAVDPLIAMRAE